MLLGQAESGKSTLQKQFQLYYSSHSLERERPAWRPVVYFNIIKAVRMILEELDYEFTQPQSPNSPPLPQVPQPQSYPRQLPSPQPSRSHTPSNGKGKAPEWSSGYANNSNGKGKAPEHGTGTANWSANGTGRGWRDDLAELRTKLLPLIAVEDTLASDLSGGVTVTGGRTGVFVRAGWQALLTPTVNRAWPAPARGASGPPPNDLVARMLTAARNEIVELWRHPSVRALVNLRKLRLEESAAL